MASEIMDTKYTDADVRRSEALYQIAENWLQLYQGEFEFLVHAKGYLLEHGSIPIPIARGVLNCMRTDPDGWRMLPRTPTGRLQIAKEHPHLQVVLPPAEHIRPALIDLPTRWHMHYVMSTHIAGRLAHILDKERTKLRYFPHTQEYRCIGPYTLCNRRLGFGVMTNNPGNRDLCDFCIQKETS